MSPPRPCIQFLCFLGLSALLGVARGNPPQAQGQAAPQAQPRPPVAPVADSSWQHAPFEAGECSLCHEKDDPKAPGPVKGKIDELCFGCHDGVQELMAGSVTKHPPALDACTSCHNPHNSKQKKGLVQPMPGLCYGCHADFAAKIRGFPVKHAALEQGASCLNCHNPHGSKVEHLLAQLPYDLCVNCHAQDGLKDEQGKALTNIKSLLEKNPVLHGPVEAKDCSSCHMPHGGENFRMLVLAYPAKFYAPYDKKNYELCFSCHNDQAIEKPQTTTLTGFRDGDKNLHYVHVDRADNGRTCRACHEVHAAEQVHIIRNGVPYGSKGWILPLHYEPTPDGGSCAKTCHATRTYDRKKQPAKEAP
jgi:predicted CXXCH cytochrome family protein